MQQLAVRSNVPGLQRSGALEAMKCAACRGACCEEIILEVAPRTPADEEFLLARGATPIEGAVIFKMEARCPQLTSCGQCAIHFTRKPVVCVLYEAGGADCLDAVSRRRTREEYQGIRDEGDPMELTWT